jgi:hypothetical protein
VARCAEEAAVVIRLATVRRGTGPLATLLFCLASSPLAALAQDIGHGTFYLFGISSDFAVVAIDSRDMLKTTATDRFNDRTCKIRPLPPTAFFFSVGIETAIQQATGKTIFEARDMAKDVYASAGSSRDFTNLAETWASRMEATLRQLPLSPSIMKGLAAKGYFAGARGFFVGTNADGDIAVGTGAITYRAEGKVHFTHAAEAIAPTATLRIAQSANQPALDVEKEFVNGGQTDRAKKIIQDNAWAKIGDGADGQAQRFENIVAAVRDWSGNPAIGGDIAVIILERGKTVRWFHRPDYCPEK